MWKGPPSPAFSIAYSLATTEQILFKFGFQFLFKFLTRRVDVVSSDSFCQKLFSCQVFCSYLEFLLKTPKCINLGNVAR